MATGKDLMALLPHLSDLVKREEVNVSKVVADAIRTKGIKKILSDLERELKGLNDIAMDILSSLAVGRHVLIMGPVGIGKTTLAETLAEILHISEPPYIEVACHSHMTATELTGDIDIAVALQAGLDHPLAYIPGPLVMAHGGILILDEINRLNPYSQAALLQVLQEHYVFIRGFRIRSDFLVIATSNPAEYSGVYELSEALADRMKVVEIPYPDKDLLKTILSWKSSMYMEHLGLKAPDALTDVTATFMTLVTQDSNIEVGPSIRSAIFAITTAMSRAWLEGREVTLNDLKREIISNMVNVIRGNFANETEKRDYLVRKFDEAMMMYRRYSRK
ncbi:MAG: MoxR family ATPase [Vulcanisaeta sp.]|jgi:MoxR-like ATPases|uniref:AAA family ATPase n=1 Tax=Vulcanisaeta sp. EB80 TaxID=1650660 RepID=UPI00074717BC|nr:MoxR family ATPase [Vulcanisaeta sp. EB80]KUO79645.1 MAG: ATPase [Vulcanisaeta sp. JCHS_4]MCG2864808.1 MoxR family ATPase [Vulcanisaeta sp.]PVU72793.1 MoxR family ATPase [Vulcanisaeta sp. SCGC AB-777_J10]MCG2866430.1 MoxR family ATPase [Vulcanisaeta sp.]MCG2885435.1 MoxR family ATPase [Vulcanisaeta sp.]